MGIDVEVHVRMKPGTEPPEMTHIGVWKIPDGLARESGATHRVSSMLRYYAPGYERGYWPQIATDLMELLANEDVEQVWYDGDCSDAPGEAFTEATLIAITQHYIHNEYRPYQTKCER